MGTLLRVVVHAVSSNSVAPQPQRAAVNRGRTLPGRTNAPPPLRVVAAKGARAHPRRSPQQNHSSQDGLVCEGNKSAENRRGRRFQDGGWKVQEGRVRDGHSPELEVAKALNKDIQLQLNADQLDDLLEQRLEELDAVHLCTAARRLVELCPSRSRDPPALIHKLVDLATDRLDAFHGRQLTSFTWALAKLRWKQQGQGQEDEQSRFLPAVESRAIMVLSRGGLSKSVEVSLLLWSMATLGYRPNALRAALEAEPRVHETLRSSRPREVSNLAWALAKWEAADSPLLPTLVERAREVVRGSSRQELSVVAWSFAKLAYDTSAVRELFSDIADIVIPQLEKYNAHDMAMLAWAIGKLRCNSNNLLEAIAEEATPRLGEFTPQGLSNLVWALARCDIVFPRLMSPLADEVSERAHTFSAQGWTNMTWAVAQIGERDCVHTAALLDTLATAMTASVHSLSSRYMANVVWGLATIQFRSFAIDNLLVSIALEAGIRGREFSPKALSNLLWGFAKLGVCTDETLVDGQQLLNQLSPHIQSATRKMCPQDISNLSWAFARLRYYDSALLDAMAVRAAATLDDFSSQAVANTVWSYASLQKYSSALLDSVAHYVPPRLPEFSNQGLANLAWSYARLDYVAPKPLFRAIAGEVVGRLPSMSPLSIASLVSSFAKLYILDRRLFEAVDATVVDRVADFQFSNAKRLIAAYAGLGYRSAAALPLLGQAAEGALASMASSMPGFSRRERWNRTQRLHYTSLMVEVFTSGSLPNLPNLPREMTDDVYQPDSELQ